MSHVAYLMDGNAVLKAAVSGKHRPEIFSEADVYSRQAVSREQDFIDGWALHDEDTGHPRFWIGSTECCDLRFSKRDRWGVLKTCEETQNISRVMEGYQRNESTREEPGLMYDDSSHQVTGAGVGSSSIGVI